MLTFRLVFFAAMCAWTACSRVRAAPSLPQPDATMFKERVYPILLADCAFAGCHGEAGRFLRVHGPGRTRLRADTSIYAPPTSDEIALAYTRAISMMVNGDDVADLAADTLLLRKPLSAQAGGTEHGGVNAWGMNVYTTQMDPRWQVLQAWAETGQGGADASAATSQ